MSIDLETQEGRKQYLSDKLDDLLDGINESYGKVLMAELLNRLECTIKDFNDEMKTLCDQLVKKEEERQHLMDMLKSTDKTLSLMKTGEVSASGDVSQLDTASVISSGQEQSDRSEEDMPIWEKKLSKLEKK